MVNYKLKTVNNVKKKRAMETCLAEGVVEEEIVWDDMHTLLYLKWITNKDLLYSTGKFAQCYVAAWTRRWFGGEWIHVSGMAESLCYLPETITILLIGYTPK